MSKNPDPTVAPKTITCAVRLDKPLYDRLVESAKVSHKSLSEVIRAGLLKQLDDERKAVIQRDIEMNSLENELSKVQKLKKQMEELISQKKAQ